MPAKRYERKRHGESDFLKLFCEAPPCQCFDEFPASFLRDTFKKVFVRNELIRGTLMIQNRRIGVKDYPASVPIWALGGTQDNIAPCGQAIGHMERIEGVAQEDRLVLCCDAGHMGLFRSGRVLDTHYSRITRFLLERSNR
jgi:poly-beta-hydroxyalkanoate depolymerase